MRLPGSLREHRKRRNQTSSLPLAEVSPTLLFFSSFQISSVVLTVVLPLTRYFCYPPRASLILLRAIFVSPRALLPVVLESSCEIHEPGLVSMVEINTVLYVLLPFYDVSLPPCEPLKGQPVFSFLLLRPPLLPCVFPS